MLVNTCAQPRSALIGKITNQICHLMVRKLLPFSLVDDKELKILMHIFDVSYSLPSHQKIVRRISAMEDNGALRIRAALQAHKELFA